MTVPVPVPTDEPGRLAALHEQEILDTPPEGEFDEITGLAAEICGTPIALITLVDERRQWFKSRVGLEVTETPREVAFCAHTICGKEIFLVPDAMQDLRFVQNALVVQEPNIRFYAGAPLLTPTGEALGTLCVIDRVPRMLTDRQKNALEVLGRQVMKQMQARQQVRELQHTGSLLNAVINGTPDAVYVKDPAGRYLLFNEGAGRLVGRAADEVVGMLDSELFGPDEARLLRLKDVEIMATGKVITEDEVLTAAGVTRTYSATKAPYRDTSGRIAGVVGISRDITAHRQVEKSQRESDLLFREMADNIGEIFYSYDVINDRILYANNAYESIWGRTIQSVYENPVSYMEAILPEDKPYAAAAFEMQLEGKETNVEFRIARPSGEIRWVHEHGVPVLDVLGRVERIVGTMRDITDSKLNAEKIRESEERFRLLSKATNEVVWDWNLVTGHHWFSDRFYSVFGYRHAELPPTLDAWKERVHPDDLQPVMASLQQAIDGGAESWTGEYRFYREDGTFAYIFDRGHIKRDRSGRAVRMIGGMTDLTSRKQAEEKLREQATLLDKAQDAILVRDLQHRILYWNRSAERLYGWTAEEVQGRSIHELLYTDTAPFFAAVAVTLNEGEWTGVLNQVGKDGHTITVEGRWTLVRDEQGRPKSILSINTDITERKRLEQQFLRAQRLESIGTLAGGIAHDLNNVLAPIMMSIELLKMEEQDVMRRSILDTIELSAQRGADMVKQVLSFARGMEGQQLEVQVGQMIRDIEKITRDTFPKDILLHSEVDAGLWAVQGDATQLHQVLLNLCVNARDAMPDGGLLTVMATNTVLDASYAAMNPDAREGPYVNIQVEDSGAGMSPQVVERIFEPFFTTKELGKGTGLGLSTTLAIIKSHGGFIRVQSEPGRGSRFQVYLPALTAQGAMVPALPEQSLPRGTGECILVVDDEAAVRQITQQTLEAFGYRVLVAADGSEAIAIYATRQKEITAVLTDMMMPEMDGPAVIRVVKRMNPAVKVIAASGLNAASMIAKATEEGVRHFIPKPYTAETLLTVVKTVLSA
ncbi:PAS domain S-box protein [Prosthecobacter sp. SYSU 5D2]|uniref:PAS domain S-box protein n=1 Tax=Prosthecobacter sp. SYSU 5D2 TaxID=3134134 RepID=UPI0031FECE23